MSGFACFLPSEAMIHLRGNKIPEFLQGQLTCDTRKLSVGNAVMGALCNVKGRVLSDILVLQLSDSHIVLRLRQSLASNVADTLRRYAQFSRISVDLDSREDAIIGTRESGEISDYEPRAAGSMATTLCDGILTLRRGSAFGEVLSIDPHKPIDLAGRVARQTLDAEPRWAMETLRNGHYALELEDLGAFTPQALNYDLTGLVAFDKGCYTGQEIVARLHYKGHSKRRLQVLQAAHDLDTPAIARDTPLLTPEGITVGRCLRAESAADAPTVLAAEVQSEYLNTVLLLTNGEQLRPLAHEATHNQ
ncbi:folate-binding protein [Congregibacter variabilis]|uniref:Folate-binding protein n=1 Tax=Congregibacter variabilis TaxID=3081200 RepID=A0ABZ0I339_9GAMM|nr:folate-binding protein [Congregibacter sp. IMCC43200]